MRQKDVEREAGDAPLEEIRLYRQVSVFTDIEAFHVCVNEAEVNRTVTSLRVRLRLKAETGFFGLAGEQDFFNRKNDSV